MDRNKRILIYKILFAIYGLIGVYLLFKLQFFSVCQREEERRCVTVSLEFHGAFEQVGVASELGYDGGRNV